VLVRFADEWLTFFPAGALEQIRADLDLTYAQAGLILTAMAAGGLAGNAFTVAADFVDRRRLAGFGALAYAGCLVTIGLSTSLPLLLVAAFCWGAAGDAVCHGCEVALVDLAREDLAPAMGRVNAYGAVGDVLGPLTLAAAAALGVSWRGVFCAGGVLMLLYAAWIARQPFPGVQRAPGGPSIAVALLDAVRDRRIILLAVVDGLFGLLDEPFLGFTMAYLERERAISAAAAATVAMAVVAGGLAGFLSVSAFTSRFPARRLLLCFGALVALSVAALAVAPVLPLHLAAGGAFGFTGAVFFALLQATYLSLRPRQAGTSQAVISAIGHFGIGFPTLVGLVSDASGLGAGLGLYAAVPVVMVLLLGLEALLGRTSRRPAEVQNVS
jgi:DHA1 family inner membrane transport protein